MNSIDSIMRDIVLFRDLPGARRAEQAEEYSHWFAIQISELLLIPDQAKNTRASNTEVDFREPWGQIRYASELDAFEFLGEMIPRDQLHALALRFLRALDQADQLRFVCDDCKQQRGYFVERGFQRCNNCGYPGQ